VENARLYAMLYMTAADALIAVWDNKAYWSFWRPITAIREAGGDGNPDTQPQADWTSLVATPPYPDHPSAHTGLSGSIVKTLQQFCGSDEIGWSDTNNAGLTRSFSSVSQRSARSPTRASGRACISGPRTSRASSSAVPSPATGKDATSGQLRLRVAGIATAGRPPTAARPPSPARAVAGCRLRLFWSVRTAHFSTARAPTETPARQPRPPGFIT
jgi:hypothetical protein